MTLFDLDPVPLVPRVPVHVKNGSMDKVHRCGTKDGPTVLARFVAAHVLGWGMVPCPECWPPVPFPMCPSSPTTGAHSTAGPRLYVRTRTPTPTRSVDDAGIDSTRGPTTAATAPNGGRPAT